MLYLALWVCAIKTEPLNAVCGDVECLLENTVLFKCLPDSVHMMSRQQRRARFIQICYQTTEKQWVWWAKPYLTSEEMEASGQDKQRFTLLCKVRSWISLLGQTLVRNMPYCIHHVWKYESMKKMLLNGDWTMYLCCIGAQRGLWGWGNTC